MTHTRSPRRSTRGRPRRAAALLSAVAALAVAAVTLSGSAPASAAVAAAPSGIDRVVSLSGAIDSTCGSGIPGGAPVYTSIQAAVNAASVGQQIYVCAGTYTENVSVTTGNIDILGPNWNDPTGSSDEARIVAADASAPVINFAATSATDNGVRGLTLEGGTYGVRAQATGGCCWDHADTEGIRNNVIVGSTVAAIETNGLDSGLIAGNQITPAADADGIRTYDAAGSLDIQANTITLSGDGVGVTIGGAGEQCCQNVGGSTPADGNVITGGQTGVLVIDTLNGGLLIDANSIRFNQISGSVEGVRVQGSVIATQILDNTISDTVGSGVRLVNDASPNMTTINIFRNTITNAGQDAVEISGRVATIDVGTTASNGNVIVDPARHGVSVIGTVLTPGTTTARSLSAGPVYVRYNEITGAGDSAVYLENVESPDVDYNVITDPGNHGVEALTVDLAQIRYNTITGAATDAVNVTSGLSGSILDNTITGAGDDGIELTGGTGGMSVTLNTVTENGAGIRVTQPTTPTSNLIATNDIAFNEGYDCEDQSSGSISNPPAVGTQGNDWTTDNGPGTDSVASSSPEGICGATLTVTSALPDGVVGDGYSDAPAASGAPGPYQWYAAGLPAGLTLDGATGTVSGTPTTPVVERRITFWVRSAGGVWGRVRDFVTISDAAEPMTAAADLPDGTVGAPYTSPAPTVTGGTGPHTWSATGLPAGLTMDPSTGVVSGTPTTPVVDQPVTITVVDSLGEEVTIVVPITILPEDPGIPLTHPMAAGAGLAALAALLLARHRRGALVA